jgi:hypothetical protein
MRQPPDAVTTSRERRAPPVALAVRRLAGSALIVMPLLTSCRGESGTGRTTDTTRGVTVAAPPSPRDSAATLAWFAQRAAAIERDTAVMDRTEKPVALGAGTSGLVTAWRAGPVWRRLRVEAEGPGFRSTDNYWLSNGVFLGARLELVRPDRPTAVDQLWFRDGALYRWTDPSGRHLNPEARSTQYEVQRMRVRFDSLVSLVAADDAVRKPPR